MNAVTLLVIIALVISLIRGYQRGFGRVVLPSAGFLAGLLIGAWWAPYITSGFETAASQFAMSILVSFGAACIGGYGGELLGHKVELISQKLHLGVLNNVLGSIFQGIFVLIIVWLLAAALSNVQTYGIGAKVNDSVIVKLINRYVPPAPNVLSRVGNLFTPNGFPNVFADGEPKRAVVAPGQHVANAKVASAAQSVVQIIGNGCGGEVEGSGFVVSSGIVVTNAHVVAGVKQPNVLDSTGSYKAQVLFFDPYNDMAVLKASGLPAPAITISDQTPSENSTGAVLGYPGGGGLVVGDAVILDETRATGRDIYNQTRIRRNIFELGATVNPGNSGGPLINQDGQVTGIVFAKSANQDNLGYALVIKDLEPAIQAASSRTTGVGTGPCAVE